MSCFCFKGEGGGGVNCVSENRKRYFLLRRMENWIWSGRRTERKVLPRVRERVKKPPESGVKNLKTGDFFMLSWTIHKTLTINIFYKKHVIANAFVGILFSVFFFNEISFIYCFIVFVNFIMLSNQFLYLFFLSWRETYFVKVL